MNDDESETPRLRSNIGAFHVTESDVPRTRNFLVALNSPPTADVTVNIPQPTNTDVRIDTDPDTPGDQTALSFTFVNWNVWQSVRSTMDNDASGDDETATIVMTGSQSGGSGEYDGLSLSIPVNITDDEEPEIIPPVEVLNMTEEEDGTVSTGPSSEVEVRSRTEFASDGESGGRRHDAAAGLPASVDSTGYCGFSGSGDAGRDQFRGG